MKRERTVDEAVIIVLKSNKKALSCKDICEEIIKNNLYVFNTDDPESIVRQDIRRHCQGIDFPTASPVKNFILEKRINNTNYYNILYSNEVPTKSSSLEYVMDIEDELLPEEKIVNAYSQYLTELKSALIDKIRACHPSFFEKLVVDLLLKMGYGCDDKSGKVIGKSHDGGIDGVISEDKLGLNLIYIQAKRYSSDNNVGRPEIQGFIGAMQRAEKGVFITTSKFTREAITFADAETRKHIRLIDGDTLVELMIRHDVGLERIKEYVVYKFDDDYFNEEL